MHGHALLAAERLLAGRVVEQPGIGGRWKALHHSAGDFTHPRSSPRMYLATKPSGIGNRLQSTVRGVELYTICDAPGGVRGMVRWELFHLDGTVRMHGEKRVVLRAGESVRQKELALEGRSKSSVARIFIFGSRSKVTASVSMRTPCFLCPPRVLELARQKSEMRFTPRRPDEWEIAFTSPVFQSGLAFDLDGLTVTRASDNWFDLLSRTHQNRDRHVSRASDRIYAPRRCRVRSLVDSYE